MFEKIKKIWVSIEESMWFIPTMMGCAAVVLAFFFIELDMTLSYDDLPSKWYFYAGNRAGARSVLSTIASSMATIAGVTFSMILVTLTLASSQYGPRLLRNFITDKGNQVVLGTFVATFIYSLIVLLTIKESDETSFIPKISIIFGVFLSLCSLGVLIFFIHHAASTIQAENIIKSSFDDLQAAVNKFMDNEPEDDLTLEKLRHNMNLDAFHQQLFPSPGSGYLQQINYQTMCGWAAENNVIIQLLVQPGDFCTIMEPQLLLYHRSELPEGWEDKLKKSFVLGSKRTPEQEIKFSIKQIVEIAVRALSPGINDPHTAISGIHYLGGILPIIGTKYFHSIVEKDEKGNIRVIRKENDYAGIVDACFDHLRLYAKSNILVTTEMLMAMKRAAAHTIHPEMRKALQQKATVVMEQLRMETMPASDFQKAEAVFEEIVALKTVH